LGIKYPPPSLGDNVCHPSVPLIAILTNLYISAFPLNLEPSEEDIESYTISPWVKFMPGL
jgi:hypothetical protein